MPRYVDIQILKSFHPKGILQEDWNAFVNDMPTIEERKKGAWVFHHYMYDYCCTVCGNPAKEWKSLTDTPTWKYCPNCGADMRGDSE